MSYEELPVMEAKRPPIVLCECRPDSEGSRHHCRMCRGAGRLTTCKICKSRYPYHNAYTPVLCTRCDPEAYANPPVGIKRDNEEDDDEPKNEVARS